MRQTIQYIIKNLRAYKAQLISISEKFDQYLLLDSNSETYNYTPHNQFSTHDLIVGAGAFNNYEINPNTNPDDIYNAVNQNNDWLLGHICYEFKDFIFPTNSYKKDKIGFPVLAFFQPLILVRIKENIATIEYLPAAEEKFLELFKPDENFKQEATIAQSIQWTNPVSKADYVKAVEKLKYHIARGDMYETNYCIPFESLNCNINPQLTFKKLNNYSPAPFAAFYKNYNKYLLSSSPERYLQKKGQQLISQPIKGTLGKTYSLDEAKMLFATTEKEKIENTMIVDLVRNDLSVVAEAGSVEVTEYCNTYEFKHVYQLVSTIKAIAKSDVSNTDIIKATFPMGSMTGAPKLNVLKFTEEYEYFRRGLYSGTVGYIDPSGNFDFNVVIRSLLYNHEEKYLATYAGSAITSNCVAEKEYEECLLKIKPIMDVLK